MSTVTTLIKPIEITRSGIFKAAPVGTSFDASLLAPNIYLAEDRFLKDFINKAFYDDLVLQKNILPSNYNPQLGAIVLAYPTLPLYENLWTQALLPFLSRAVYWQSLPSIVLQAGSIGLYTNNSEFSQSAGISGLKFMLDNELQNLERTKSIIINFLCDNKTDYPLFSTTGYCSDCEEEPKLLAKSGFITYKKK